MIIIQPTINCVGKWVWWTQRQPHHELPTIFQKKWLTYEWLHFLIRHQKQTNQFLCLHSHFTTIHTHTLHFCQSQDNVWVSGTNIVPFSPPFSFSVSDNQWRFQTFNLKEFSLHRLFFQLPFAAQKVCFCLSSFHVSCIGPLCSLTPSLFKAEFFYFSLLFYGRSATSYIPHRTFVYFSFSLFTWFWNLIWGLRFSFSLVFC